MSRPHMLDAIVIVSEWGFAEHEPLLEKLARIGIDETSVLGVVLNKAEVKGAASQPVTSRKAKTLAATV